MGTSSGLSGGPALSTAQLSFLCRSPHFPKRQCLTCSILLVLRSSLPIAEPETQRSLLGPLTLLLRAHFTARSLLVHVALVLRPFVLRLFCFNAPCQYTPVPNLPSLNFKLTLNIPSLARQRCLSSWGPRRTPWFFCNFSTV